MYEIRTFPNVSKRGKTSEIPQKSKVLLRVLTRISLKGLNRGCETGMSLNRLNKVYEIRTFPNALKQRKTSETPQNCKAILRVLKRISLKGFNEGATHECC